ncbi:unnamed protein product [Choristocarpus tenellus]
MAAAGVKAHLCADTPYGPSAAKDLYISDPLEAEVVSKGEAVGARGMMHIGVGVDRTEGLVTLGRRTRSGVLVRETPQKGAGGRKRRRVPEEVQKEGKGSSISSGQMAPSNLLGVPYVSNVLDGGAAQSDTLLKESSPPGVGVLPTAVGQESDLSSSMDGGGGKGESRRRWEADDWETQGVQRGSGSGRVHIYSDFGAPTSPERCSLLCTNLAGRGLFVAESPGAASSQGARQTRRLYGMVGALEEGGECSSDSEHQYFPNMTLPSAVPDTPMKA